MAQCMTAQIQGIKVPCGWSFNLDRLILGTRSMLVLHLTQESNRIWGARALPLDSA
jgi:hypothetical protein